MKKTIYLVVNHSNQLEAVDMEGETVLTKFKQGETLRAVLTKPRNSKHHRKFFAMLNLVFQNQDIYDVLEDLLTEVKLRTGHYKAHVTVKGKVIYIPKSISFDELDQLEFDDIYEKAIKCCLKYFIKPDNDELIDQIIRF